MLSLNILKIRLLQINYRKTTSPARWLGFVVKERLTLGDFKGYNTAWVDSTNYEEKSLAYDLNGNINRLVRTNSSGGSMADYTYNYKGNQLNQINSLTAYTYDKNGNTTLDGLRGFTIAYNSLNLPKSITSGIDNIAYIYSALGEKLAKKMKDNTYQYYCGNMVYKNDKSLNYLLFEEGLVDKSSGGYTYEYHLKDHLGNTRVTFQPNGSATTTTQVAEYYPFGSSYLPISPAGTNKYLYNGKEKQDDILGGTALDWYDYGARFYDPMIGRWHVIDPMIENGHHNYTPYAYVYNNPIGLIDPFGLDSVQRVQALEMAQKIVNANPQKDPKLYDPKGKGNTGAKGDKPGEAMDCSGMAANCRIAGDEPDPVDTKEGVQAAENKFGKGKTNGVKQLAATAVPVDKSDLEPGNEVYLNNYRHIGIVTKVNTDNDGSPISIEFQHSGSSTGPTTGTANLNGTGYWGSRINSFGKWDTKPEKVAPTVYPVDKDVENHY